MHPTLKAQLKQDLTVYPFIGCIDGDMSFGEAKILKCFSVPTQRKVINREGEEVVSNTTIYLDGESLKDIHEQDEVELEYVSRRAIITISPYPSPFTPGYDMVEVVV